MHSMLTNSNVVAKELDIRNYIGIVDVGKTIERILGMHWMSSSDSFIFELKLNEVSEDVFEINNNSLKTGTTLYCYDCI